MQGASWVIVIVIGLGGKSDCYSTGRTIVVHCIGGRARTMFCDVM